MADNIDYREEPKSTTSPNPVPFIRHKKILAQSNHDKQGIQLDEIREALEIISKQLAILVERKGL